MFFSKKNQKDLFISSDSRRKGTKEDCYPKPLHRGLIDFGQKPPFIKVLVSLTEPLPLRGERCYFYRLIWRGELLNF